MLLFVFIKQLCFLGVLIRVNNVIFFHNYVVQFILKHPPLCIIKSLYGTLLIPKQNERSIFFNCCIDFTL